MNPLGSRVSHFYHKALNPTTVPIIIDNKLFILTEQLSRHIVDTKLSFLIPYPQTNDGILKHPEYSQFQPNNQIPLNNQVINSMPLGSVEQQLILERMHAKFVMDMMNANANQQLINQTLSNNNGVTATQPRVFHDASTHTYDLMPTSDIEMKSV